MKTCGLSHGRRNPAIQGRKRKGPERTDVVAELDEKLLCCAEWHIVEPGLTGWAQIDFRYGSTIEDARRKLQFDLCYLKHMSFELDMIIHLRTIGTLLRGACRRGCRGDDRSYGLFVVPHDGWHDGTKNEWFAWRTLSD